MRCEALKRADVAVLANVFNTEVSRNTDLSDGFRHTVCAQNGDRFHEQSKTSLLDDIVNHSVTHVHGKRRHISVFEVLDVVNSAPV